ncbi:MAG: SMC family ATPase [Nitrososphaerales archaeon]
MTLLTHLSLKNIRSFNDGSEVSIDFPEGTVLFEGDIGSGKSTILYAVEFALFGLGDMSGSYLLSEGTNSGHAKVRVTQGGRNLEIYRGLRRTGENVVQENCYISEDGTKTELSPGDLKQRVISLLGFNEPSHPRAESLVFRYAVFTPQEQMKEIVQRNADDRLLVIRRVLGIQSYQVAAENSDLIHRRLRNEARAIEAATEDLEEIEAEAALQQSRIKELSSRIPQLQNDEAAAKAELTLLTKQWEDARDEREKVGAAAGRIPELRRSIARLHSDIEEDEKRVSELERSLEQEYVPSIKSFQARAPPSKRSATVLETSLKSRQNTLDRKRESLALLAGQLKETKELVKGRVCPRCGQRIPDDFRDQSAHLETELEGMTEEVSALEDEISGLEDLVKKTLLYAEEEREHRRNLKRKTEMDADIADRRNHGSESRREMRRLEDELSRSEAEEARMSELTSRIDRIAGALRMSQDRKESASRELVESITKQSEGTESLKRLTSQIEERKMKRAKGQRLKSYASWLDDFFKPTVELIERQVMVQTNSRFSEHFQRFFSSLVDDPDLRVRVLEDFSPVFERQGYFQEFDSLSGGERTSIALAYRFALNAIVQEDIGSGAGDLVILDEPTDGFSKEQIQKMRDVIEELHSRQVILVSHEKELESMADRLMLVEKVNGTSKVSSV